MADIQLIDVGIANDPTTGDTLREGANKINANALELESRINQKVSSNVAIEPAGSDAITNIVSLTQAEYDAGTPNPNTLYIIKN